MRSAGPTVDRRDVRNSSTRKGKRKKERKKKSGVGSRLLSRCKCRDAGGRGRRGRQRRRILPWDGTRPACGALCALITIHLSRTGAFLGFDGRSVQPGRLQLQLQRRPARLLASARPCLPPSRSLSLSLMPATYEVRRVAPIANDRPENFPFSHAPDSRPCRGFFPMNFVDVRAHRREMSRYDTTQKQSVLKESYPPRVEIAVGTWKIVSRRRITNRRVLSRDYSCR